MEARLAKPPPDMAASFLSFIVMMHAGHRPLVEIEAQERPDSAVGTNRASEPHVPRSWVQSRAWSLSGGVCKFGWRDFLVGGPALAIGQTAVSSCLLPWSRGWGPGAALEVAFGHMFCSMSHQAQHPKMRPWQARRGIRRRGHRFEVELRRQPLTRESAWVTNEQVASVCHAFPSIAYVFLRASTLTCTPSLNYFLHTEQHTSNLT